MMSKSFKDLINECGLSQKGAARLLGVSYNTVKSWYYERNPVPEGVMIDMNRYLEAKRFIFDNPLKDH